ncbi:tetratricopeptide repeat protein [Kiritimatiellaeota bacterium B1221]|nr:tetratricopeptide repeat protein [Kiritimatiellaeota bacterium B1221]
MKTILSLLVLTMFCRLQAQSAPASLIAQVPYIAEVEGDAPAAFLNISGILEGLEPLPDFQIPRQLPNEFILTDLGRVLMQKSQEANRFLMEGKPEEAVTIFKEALEKWPDELGIRVALADSLYAMGDHEQAVQEYQAVLEKIPLHFQCLNNLAWLFATTEEPGLRDLDRAARLAEIAKVVQPRSHHLWSTLSQIHFENGEYGEAEQAIGNALLIAQQTQVNLEVMVSYLIQRDRCILALQATSLLE